MARVQKFGFHNIDKSGLFFCFPKKIVQNQLVIPMITPWLFRIYINEILDLIKFIRFELECHLQREMWPEKSQKSAKESMFKC